MQYRRDPPPLARLLRGARPHRRALGLADLAGPVDLLFVIAGMVPFIPYMPAARPPPWPRATSVQKCVRTLDIEEVGKTTRHGTFFQMNGNFSFGDYFKEGAISYAWELVTGSREDGGYGFDPDTIWVTVFHDDDEAADALEADRRPARRAHPAPRLEGQLLVHRRAPARRARARRSTSTAARSSAPEGGPAVDDGTGYLEIWNLVFMQYERGDGERQGGLPDPRRARQKNIDTGMGLERVAYLLQGVDNLYEIDEVCPVMRRAAELAGVTLRRDHDDDVRMRVVADHVRSALMLIGDGVTPGNEGRGYVLRRLLRRSVRSMRLLGVEDAALPALLPVIPRRDEPIYPELATDFERIARSPTRRRRRSGARSPPGTTLFDTAVQQVKQAGAARLSGTHAFQLHDTYGFPIDLTLEMAAEQGVTVDEPPSARS